ncbi:hypothetical protein R1flu_028268 [Riccia fluitans]|uniref:Uncharacterized protein n=1 Tax=Riccia fluitans TaxID=41844 RepID=A0ABD1XL70_9MARC
MENSGISMEEESQRWERTTPPPPTDEIVLLSPWRKMVQCLVKLLTHTQKNCKKLKEQQAQMEEKLKIMQVLLDTSLWCTQQLQTTRDAEAPLLATVEKPKKTLMEHGVPIPPDVTADEVEKVKDHLRGEEDRLAVMLGHKPPVEGVLMDDNHVTKMLELARIMIG